MAYGIFLLFFAHKALEGRKILRLLPKFFSSIARRSLFRERKNGILFRLWDERKKLLFVTQIRVKRVDCAESTVIATGIVEIREKFSEIFGRNFMRILIDFIAIKLQVNLEKFLG